MTDLLSWTGITLVIVAIVAYAYISYQEGQNLAARYKETPGSAPMAPAAPGAPPHGAPTPKVDERAPLVSGAGTSGSAQAV